MENFARNYIGNTSGSSIEEYSWGVAALYKLETCTRSAGDISLYDSLVNSFGTSKSNFIIMSSENIPNRSDLNPSFTFQFGEAASGLLLGGIPYNDPVVLEAMDAVYQSNVSGTLLNQPFHGDLANTETIPAYLLSTSLFQSEMRSGTNGYWISGIKNANVTSIDYYNGTLLISAYGNNGTIVVSSSGKPNLVFSNINGFATEHVTAATTTTKSSSCSVANTFSCLGLDWLVLIVSAVFFIIGALLFVMVAKAKRARL
ncbi:MAG: hypothetical protein PXY39_15235 [archaeon]|nr:hypothetical protein [archaeon]